MVVVGVPSFGVVAESHRKTSRRQNDERAISTTAHTLHLEGVSVVGDEMEATHQCVPRHLADPELTSNLCDRRAFGVR
jgi:hypothetical protein